MSASPPTPALAEALDRLRGKSGRAFWRGLDELFDHEAFRARLAEQFPAVARTAGEWQRRDILKCLGGALAMAGLDGCERSPDEHALPYIEVPEGAVPGVSRFYATAVELDGVAQPVIGKTRDGRPIKLEGNPDHPASAGATDAFTQAALLGLYDPARSAAPRERNAVTDWGAFDRMMQREMSRLDPTGGAGFRLLTGLVGSPTMLRQIAAIQRRWPAARWHVFAPVDDNLGQTLHLDSAEIVVSLDHDLLGPGPSQTFHGRGWSARRLAYQQGQGDSLLFVAEPAPTLTGVTATERLIAAQGRIPTLLQALAGRLGLGGGAPLNEAEQLWVEAAAAALDRHRGRGLLTVGPQHGPQWQQLVLAIDGQLGNLGRTRSFATQPEPRPQPFDLLVRDLEAGVVDLLLILDANPVYAAPGDVDFAAAMERARLRLHAGLHHDETARLCHWHVPTAHGLESWSDGRAADGTAVLIQPLVRPFLSVRSRHALLAPLAGERPSDHEAVRATWAENWGGAFAQRWQQALVSGRIDGSAPPSTTPAPAPVQPVREQAREGLDVLLRPDPCVWDGSFASNPWLQELPKPLTKICWGNAIHISPVLARERGLENGDRVRLAVAGRSIEGPVWIMPGQDARTLLVHLGHGRATGGPVAEGVGFNAYSLRSAAAPWHVSGATLEAIGGREAIATTQSHFTMAGHDFIRSVAAPGDTLPPEPEHRSFYPPQPRHDPSWGMSIDLDLCIGCNACVTACVAENNIPMVGKEQVMKGREMHWLRVDRYYEGSPDDPQHAFQPVPCMHCENAPCEMGCPVNATVHSPDGLNLQVYNRCIGTRTCSAYCPYKVRRFNWFDFTGEDPPELRAVRNPEVTVRGRGVMEKCTYCIQRIVTARIEADKEGRPLADGEVRTACQQVCPTNAITFGNIADRNSAVSARKASGRDYGLLDEAQTRPRTTYLARIDKGTRE